jgi:hypothetical protein
MSSYDLDKMIKVAEEMAKAWLVKLHHQSLMPTWELHSRKGEIYVIGTPWENEKQKRRAEKILRQKVVELDIVAYTFLTEAWMAIAKLGDIPITDLRPSLHPNRKEVVVALATDGIIRIWRCWLIIRNDKGRITDLAVDPDESISHADSTQSWMADLLQRNQ